MKKRLPIILLFTFINVFSYAQVKFGAKAGLNYVNNIQTKGEDGNNSYKISYHFGGYSIIELNDKINLIPELLYSNKGYKFDATDLSGGGNLNLVYINLPVLVAYQVSDKLGVNLGPEFGYLLSAKSKFDSRTVDVGDFWENKIDFGIALGISLSLAEKVSTELRYTHGLSSVIEPVEFRDALGNVTEGPSTKYLNRTFQLSFGYKLN